MKYSNPAPINHLSPLRRFAMALQYEPAKAALFYATLGILLFAVVTSGYYRMVTQRHIAEADDVSRAQQQTGIATVEVIQYRTSKGPSPYDHVQLGLRLAGRMAIARVPMDQRLVKVQVNDRLRVNYKVGMSGAIYIKDWEALRRSQRIGSAEGVER